MVHLRENWKGQLDKDREHIEVRLLADKSPEALFRISEE